MASKEPKRCDSFNCLNGWIRWNNSDYPCSACAEYAEYAEWCRQTQAKVVGTNEYISAARGQAFARSYNRHKKPNQLDIC